MIKSFTISSLLLFSFTGFSQKMGALGIGQTNNTKYHNVPEQIGFEGNINYFDEYQPGVVFYRDSTQIDVPLLNYNLLQNKVTLKINSDEFFLPNEHRIDSFRIADKTFVSIPNITARKTFYEILFDTNEIELIKQSNAQIVTGKEGTGMTPTTPDRVKITSRYYLVKQGAIHELVLNKTQVYEILGNQEKLDAFRKKKKLKFKKEEDVVQLLGYYSSIINL